MLQTKYKDSANGMPKSIETKDPRLRVICLSDGQDTDSKDKKDWQVAQFFQDNRIVCDLVIIGDDLDNGAHAIAKSTGGYVFQPETIQQGLQVNELETFLFQGRRPQGFEMENRKKHKLVKDQNTLAPFTDVNRYPVDKISDGLRLPVREPDELENSKALGVCENANKKNFDALLAE